jgi:hypothetical protein
MHLNRLERFLLLVASCCGFLLAWQLALHHADNSYLDGICAARGAYDLPPEARAMELFNWVSTYDAVQTPDAGGQAPSDLVAPRGLLTPRAMVEHRAYFRANCGYKAWLLAILAQRAGLEARELRLCDARHIARHVLCEIRIHGRWVVFDPMVHLAFRRADGQLATAAELQAPALLAANAARTTGYDLRRWPFDHPERLHFEKVPVIGGRLRRLAARITGRPAEELAIPQTLERPRLVAAGSFAAAALLALTGAGLSARRRRRSRERRQSAPSPLRALALESDQD